MKLRVSLLLVLALFAGVCKGQTVLGKHPKDTVLPNFFGQNGNANAAITGLNSYGTLPFAPPGGLTLGGVTRHTWPTGGVWDVPETILTNWQANVSFEHSLNLYGGGGIWPYLQFNYDNGDGTTTSQYISIWSGGMTVGGIFSAGQFQGDGSGLYNLPISVPRGVLTNGQADVHFLGLTIDNPDDTDTAWLWFHPTGLGSVPGSLSLNPAGFVFDRPVMVSGSLQVSGMIGCDSMMVGDTSLDDYTESKAKEAARDATNGWPWLALAPSLPTGVVTNHQSALTLGDGHTNFPSFAPELDFTNAGCKGAISYDPITGLIFYNTAPTTPALGGWGTGFWFSRAQLGADDASGLLNLDAGALALGTVPLARLPIDAGSNIVLTTSGSRLVINGTGTGSGTGGPTGLVTNDFTRDASLGTNNFVPINGTTAATDKLGTGTPDATRYLRGDGTWQIPPGAVTTTTNIPRTTVYSLDGGGTNFALDFNYQSQTLAFADDIVFRYSTNGPDSGHSGLVWAYVQPTNYARRLFYADAATNWVVDGIANPFAVIPSMSAAYIEAHALGSGETNVAFQFRVFTPAPVMGTLPTFTPNSIPGLIAWYVAGTGIYQDTNRTYAATNLSQPVRYWTDLSPNHYDLVAVTNCTAVYQPAGGPNSYPMVSFPPGFGLSTASFGVTNGVPFYLFFVHYVTSLDYYFDNISIYPTHFGLAYDRWYVAGTGSATNQPALNKWFEEGWQFTGVQSWIHTNGVLLANCNAGSPKLWGIHLGSPGTGNSANTYNVAEVIVYQANLNTNQAAAVEAYLGQKYALY